MSQDRGTETLSQFQHEEKKFCPVQSGFYAKTGSGLSSELWQTPCVTVTRGAAALVHSRRGCGLNTLWMDGTSVRLLPFALVTCCPHRRCGCCTKMCLPKTLVAIGVQAKSKVPLQPDRSCGIQHLEVSTTSKLDGSWQKLW